jgi:hypothetical protein
MLIAAIVLNCLVAVLLIVSAMKYGQGPVPLTYHREMLEKEGSRLSPYQEMILRALYRALAGGMLALAIMIIALSLGPVRADALWAHVAILLAGGSFAVSGIVTPHKVEAMTGVQTPWRLAAVLGGALVLAFVLAVLG